MARSPADGYMLYLATASNAINAAGAATGSVKLNYDVQKDLMPVALLVRNQNVLVANPGLPISNLRELMQMAKDKPGKLNFGVMSPSSQLAGELFRQMAKIDITDIPYRGAAPVVTDLVGGQVELAILDLRIKRLGLSERALPTMLMDADFAAVGKGLDGSVELVERFCDVARTAIRNGCEAIIPGQLYLSEAIARAGITRIDEVPVVDGLTATLKMAEAMVDFKRNGISVTRRGYTHARPPREMIEHARRVHARPEP